MDELLVSWRDSEFKDHCIPRIQPGSEKTKRNLEWKIARACFSKERMSYIQEE